MVDYFIDNQVFYHHGKFSHIVKVVLSETFLIGIAILKRLTIFVLVQTMLFYEKIITWFNSFIFYSIRVRRCSMIVLINRIILRKFVTLIMLFLLLRP